MGGQLWCCCLQLQASFSLCATCCNGFRVMQRNEVGDSAIYSGIVVFLKLMTILPYFCFLRPIDGNLKQENLYYQKKALDKVQAFSYGLSSYWGTYLINYSTRGANGLWPTVPIEQSKAYAGRIYIVFFCFNFPIYFFLPHQSINHFIEENFSISSMYVHLALVHQGWLISA